MINPSVTIQAYKIVERHGDAIKTLFHGHNKSKTIPYDTWLEANEKLVSDGKGAKYISGWHVLLEEEKANAYLSRFKTRKDKLAVIPVSVCGIRPKHKSRSKVYLAKYMKLDKSEIVQDEN